MIKFFLVLFFTINICLAAKPVYVVSVAPYKGLVQDLAAGTDCEVLSLLREGQDPHSFEFKPSAVRILEKANVYFAVGTNFEMEVRLLPALKKQYSKILFVDTAKGIPLADNNPHVWISLSNLKVIARNIKEALVSIQPDKKDIFELNYKKLEARVQELSLLGNKNFSSYAQNVFLTNHPAFIYFAKDFSLVEYSIEEHGRTPSAKDLQELTKFVKNNNIKAIVVRKGTQRGVFSAFVERNNLYSVELDYLSENYFEPLKILVDKLPKYLVPVASK